MKQFFFYIIGVVLCSHVVAQPVIPGNRSHIKLTDVIADHKKNKRFPGYEEEKHTKGNIFDLAKLMSAEQKPDYRFNHWLWYWRRHTDNNGYLVSPTATWKAWQQLKSSERHSAVRTTSSALTWTFQGPDSSGAFTGDGAGSGVGRINVIAFHPTDSNSYIIGSPGGGAWKTTNDGHSWTCLTDQLPNISVGDIKYNPHNPNTIYLCSGDRDGSDYPGVGVLKSYNGGATWITTGMAWADSLYHNANCLLINPLDTSSLILGTTSGVYRSFNGGTTWVLTDSSNFISMVYRPNDTNIVYAGSSGSGAQVYRSANGGASWGAVTTISSAGRVSVAVTIANPNLVKAITSSTDFSNFFGLDGVYTSTDTGHTFTETYTGGCSGSDLLGWAIDASDCSGQGWYDLSIAVSPVNANLVYIGGVNAWKSADGGISWQILNYWSPDSAGVATVHADKHSMSFNPLCPNRFFETNDGGVYSAYNPSYSGTWRNLTDRMGITEFYGVAVSGIASFVMAGAQDVGTKLVKHGLYEEADGGDGMWSQLDYADSTVGYASSEYGYMDRIDPTAYRPDSITTDISWNIDTGTIEGSGAWVTPFIIEPSCHTCLLAGYQAVYKSGDMGNSWTAISDTLSSSANNLAKVATTIADSNTIFVSEDATGGNIFYTHDMGTTWTTLSVPYPSLFVSDIKVDPRDKNHIWVTFSGYGSNHISEWYASTGWQTFDAGMPDIPVHCFAINKVTREMYAGTEIGVFYRDSVMTSWVLNSAGMPAVSVTDLEINYVAGEIWASTYGRSLWHALLPTDVPSIVPFSANAISISPNPNNGDFNVSLNNIADNKVDMRLVDISGRTAWQQKNVLNTGILLPVNTHGLSAGTYILEISVNGNVAGKQKLVINR